MRGSARCTFGQSFEHHVVYLGFEPGLSDILSGNSAPYSVLPLMPTSG